MDPISIITLAGSATTATYQVSKTIYEFINAVKNVDDTVSALASEMSSLRRSLDAISSALANPLVRSEKALAPENTPIWAATAGALEECRKSLSTVEKKIAPHQKEKARHTLFKRAVTVFKLNLSKDEIANLRSQIQTHTHSLQLALQMINLLVAGIGPANAVEDIGKDIAALSTVLGEIELQTDANARTATLKQVQQTAQEVLSKAPELVSSGLLEIADEDRRNRSLAALRATVSEYNQALYAEAQNDARIEAGSLDSSGAASEEQSDDSDSDDETERDLAIQLFAKGRQRFDSRDFAAAEGYYRDGLRHLASLSKFDGIGDVIDIRVSLAACCFFQGKLEEAELMLLVLSKSESNVTTLSLQAFHLLAQVYLCLYNFESALEYASLATKGRRRVLGKSHPDYYASVEALSLVYEAGGDFVTAASYKKKVPPGNPKDQGLEMITDRFGGFSSAEHLRLSLAEKRLAQVQLSEADFLRRQRPGGRLNAYDQTAQVPQFNVGSDALSLPRALLWASEHNKPLVAKWLLAKGARPNAVKGESEPLVVAAAGGNRDVVELLLLSGALTEETPGDGRTAMYWAALWGHESSVRTLLKHGANANGADKDGDTVLMAAACKGHAPIVKLLLEAGADVSRRTERSHKTALYQAVDGSYGECAEHLINAGSPLECEDWNGATALTEAISRRSTGTLKLLLKAGASVETRPGRRPILRAGLDSGNVEITEALIEAGCDVEELDQSGGTAFQLAAQRRSAPVMRLLLAKGADPNVTPDGKYAGSVLKHESRDERILDLLRDFPQIKDCRDGSDPACVRCSRWDKDLGYSRP